MNPRYVLFLVIVVVFVGAGCSSLPGLRVLTGEDTGTNPSLTVEELDLVMADKTGATDPSLIAAADRIEAASGNVDVIEIRHDFEADAFNVDLLFAPPNAPATLEGQIMQLDALRRAVELTWQGLLTESQGADTIRIRVLNPQSVSTLDTGAGFIGIVQLNAEIAREDAATYLAGDRSLDTFYGLIVDGTLLYQSPESLQLYEGTPNHPMFMLPAQQQDQ